MNIVKRVLASLAACSILLVPGLSSAAQYFGYYLIASGTNFTSEASGHTNISWSGEGYNNSAITNDLYTAVYLNQKLVIDVSSYFFSGNQLRSDYATRWASLVSALNATGYTSSIAAFYPQDEPGSSFSTSDLQTAISTIKSSYPNVPVAVIYQYDVNANYNAIQSFDWVGIDCYSNGNWMCGSKTYSDAYKDLRSHAASTSKFIVVPQAGVTNSAPTCCIAALQKEIERFYELSFADSRIVAIVPFIWQTVSTSGYTGLRDANSTALLSSFQNVGNGVKSGWTFPSGIVPVFRFYLNGNNDHLFTLSGNEGIVNGFNFESVGFSIYSSQISGTVPLYRCYDGSHHMLSPASNCDGVGYAESVIGYLSPYQTSGTTALYRFYNSGSGGYLATTDYSEGTSAGLSYLGIAGYVPTVSIP